MIWVLLALCLGSSVRADIRFDVFVGFDGVVPEASWFPVTIETYNDGQGFQGVIELTTGSFGEGQDRSFAVELPTGTQKRFVIPVFAAGRGGSSYNARLLDEKGAVLAQASQVRPRYICPWQLPLMASISRVTPTLPKTNQRDVDLRMARLQPALFPDNPIALEGLSTLYLSSSEAIGNSFQVDQVQALLSWLYSGGHLIVGIDQPAHIEATEWLRRLMPWSITDVALVKTHPQLQEWVTSDQRTDGRPYDFIYRFDRDRALQQTAYPNPFAKLQEDPAFEQEAMELVTGRLKDGKVIIGADQQPILVTSTRGRGRLTVLGFNPDRQPFRSWKNQPYFWAKLSGLPPELWTESRFNLYGGGYGADGIFGAMIETDQIRKLPVRWLLVLLLVYLVVIGPLDHWWLKKIGKQMLTWVTFPVYVALFSGLIYLIGYRLRAGDTEWNELHVVDVTALPSGGQADLHGRSYASIYSPVNATYRVACAETFATFRAELLGNFTRGQESSRASVMQRGNRFDARIFVPVWTSQLYVADWLRQDTAPVSFSVSSGAAGYDVTIDNSLGEKLEPVRLVVNRRVYEVAEVPANKVMTLSLAVDSGLALDQFVREHGAQFQDAVRYRQQAFGRNEPVRLLNVPLGAMAASFISELPAPNSYDHYATPSGFDLSDMAADRPLLLAWINGFAPIERLNQFSTSRGHRDTLLRVAATPSKTL